MAMEIAICSPFGLYGLLGLTTAEWKWTPFRKPATAAVRWDPQAIDGSHRSTWRKEKPLQECSGRFSLAGV
jgi:hypothetical protein